MPTPKTLIVHFKFEKETSNGVVRFMEIGDKKEWKMGRVYIKPEHLAVLGSPTALTLTITKGK